MASNDIKDDNLVVEMHTQDNSMCNHAYTVTRSAKCTLPVREGGKGCYKLFSVRDYSFILPTSDNSFLSV